MDQHGSSKPTLISKRPSTPRSTSQRSRIKLVYVPEDPLLTAREAAAERAQGLSTFWRDVKQGRVPAPIYVTPRCPRWRRSRIRASVEG